MCWLLFELLVVYLLVCLFGCFLWILGVCVGCLFGYSMVVCGGLLFDVWFVYECVLPILEFDVLIIRLLFGLLFAVVDLFWFALLLFWFVICCYLFGWFTFVVGKCLIVLSFVACYLYCVG